MATILVEARISRLPDLSHAARADGREDLYGPSLSPVDSGIGVIQFSRLSR